MGRIKWNNLGWFNSRVSNTQYHKQMFIMLGFISVLAVVSRFMNHSDIMSGDVKEGLDDDGIFEHTGPTNFWSLIFWVFGGIVCLLCLGLWATGVMNVAADPVMFYWLLFFPGFFAILGFLKAYPKKFNLTNDNFSYMVVLWIWAYLLFTAGFYYLFIYHFDDESLWGIRLVTSVVIPMTLYEIWLFKTRNMVKKGDFDVSFKNISLIVFVGIGVSATIPILYKSYRKIHGANAF